MRLWPASVRKAGKRKVSDAPRESRSGGASLPSDMSRGAADMQQRLEDARSRLKDTVPPRADEE